MFNKFLSLLFMLVLSQPAYSIPMVNAYVLQQAGSIGQGDQFAVDFRIAGIATQNPFFGSEWPLREFSVGIRYDPKQLQLRGTVFKPLDPTASGGTPPTINGFPELSGAGTFSRGTQFSDIGALAAFQTSDPQFTLVTWTFEALIDKGEIPFHLTLDLTDIFSEKIPFKITSDSVFIPTLPPPPPNRNPEPASLALVWLGIVCLIFVGRKSPVSEARRFRSREFLN